MDLSEWRNIMRMFVTLAAILFAYDSCATIKNVSSEHEEAALTMSVDPDRAESILRLATTMTEKMDYALFLHSHRGQSAERDLQIKEILDQINHISTISLETSGNSYTQSVLGGSIIPYDGTDKAIIPTLRLATTQGVIRTHSAFYAIPCAVLVSRPGLLDATGSYWGGNRDNFLPRSGCRWGRGGVPGFPSYLVNSFVLDATCCDGDFTNTFEGTARYWHMTSQVNRIESLKFLEGPSVASDLPDCPENVLHNCFGSFTRAEGAKGFTYVGEFKDSKRNGQGTLTFTIPDGTMVMEGEWNESKDAVIAFQGTVTSPDGSIMFGEVKDREWHTIYEVFTTQDQQKNEYPYQTWSYLSLHNRKSYGELIEAYKPAHSALAKYYRDQRGFGEKHSLAAAKYGLLSSVFGAECGGMELQKSLRGMIIDGVEIVEIKEFVYAENYRNEDAIQPFHDCSYFAKIDPLIHIAVKDEEVLELLWNYNQTIDLSDDRRFALDFVLDVDAPNFFNKTPLMTSAQFDLIKSAEFLISKGASVGLKTEEEWNRLEHDQRTALMYAAANASLEMISLLLNHGADVSAKDSKGLRAVDYLLGRGPVPANPKLQEEDLKLAIALLE
jgi:hypothetical protein